MQTWNLVGATSIGLLLSALPGCYAALGPTIGVDLPTGRTTVGIEASGATVTIAHSVALGSATRAEPPGRAEGAHAERAVRAPPLVKAQAWSSRTYLLWEPGLGVASGNTKRAVDWGSAGGSFGLRLERFPQDATRARFAAGGWLGAGHTLSADTNHECGGNDARAYAALIVGFRGSELYMAPKIGLATVPRLCLFGPDAHLVEGGY